MKKITIERLKEEVLNMSCLKIKEIFNLELKKLIDFLEVSLYEHKKKIDMEALIISADILLIEYGWTCEDVFEESQEDYYFILKSIYNVIFD